MSTSKSPLHGTDPFTQVGELSHAIVAAALGLALALLLGGVGARALRSRGLHWSWAGVPAASAWLLRSMFGHWALLAVLACLAALRRGRRWHREDLAAGADLARIARLRASPAGAVLALLGELRLRLRLRRLGLLGFHHEGRLILGWAVRGRLVTVPFGGVHGGSHMLLVGATGSGKTVTQTWIATRGIEHGMGAVVIDPKGDPTMRAALARVAERCGREFVEWTPTGPRPYNPFARGSDSEVADKVLAGERFTEPHYLRQAQRFLGHAVRALRASGAQTSLGGIAQALDPATLEMLARQMPEQAARVTHAYLDSLTARQVSDIAGIRDRLSILAESDVAPWLEPRQAFDLLDAVRARAVVYFDLEADRRPLLTQMLGAAIVQDLQTTVAVLQSQPVSTVVVIDEFSALAAEQVVRLFGRARSAGLNLVLGTQELSDLRLPGREALLEQVLGNLAAVIAHRQVVPASAELVCRLAGVRGAWRVSQSDSGRASRTRTRESVLQPEEVTSLAPGCAAAISFGEHGRTEIVRVFLEGAGRMR